MRRVVIVVVLALGLGGIAPPLLANASSMHRSPTADGAESAPETAAPADPEAPVTAAAGTGALRVESRFVSSTGWVKPGDTYPFRILLTNTGPTISGVHVTVTAPDGAVLVEADRPAAQVTAGTLTWDPAELPAGTADAASVTTLVVEARAESTAEDPQVVWKDLSTTATVTFDGGPAGGIASTSHGPKVIPADPSYDSARYGDRPFPVVPVAYTDRAPVESAEDLARKINDPEEPGSTFNLYQEMSFGQLYPQADVPSAGIASAGFDYAPGFDFTSIDPASLNTCTGGLTLGGAGQEGSALYPDRIKDGWYQLPGNTAYYGADGNGSALIGALAGVGALQAIDSGCGPTGKAVFDAAQIADPEIDYDDFDTDKDGVVDFFMMVFTGLGGNGSSQGLGCDETTIGGPECPTVPYDNIWPHSSSLEFSYVDPETGLGGYRTDDQLTSLSGVPQCWTDDTYTVSDDCAADGGAGDDTLPHYVRVGPYNVNPESAIRHASVISHEYGHSLGLPDFYTTGSRETYGDWNIMATDKSQDMDVYSRQELGWVVPTELHTGTYTGLQESDTDIHRIEWQTPAGDPYVLTGPDVHNGPAWMAKLPARQIIDPALVESQASASHLWWSQSGNDFGCAPNGGHNVDVYLPEMADVPAGTDVQLDFKSYFDIEWDFDYGFVLASTDGGQTWSSLASRNGYTTPATQNPNANPCQATFGNGITGTGSSYDAGTAPIDRVLGSYGDPVFVDDAYDLSSLAGHEVVLRFSYATDPGLARPGWFIDDLNVTAGGTSLYATDFESTGGPDDARIFNGGCQEGLGGQCTKGWQFIDSSAGSAADHAYYLELRDRSGFDLDGRGENDRDPIGFAPGLLLTYTDEAHGYGNVGTDDPPAQSPLDSQPDPGNETPDLNDAAFTAAAGDSAFSDFGDGWIDNYTDPSQDSICVANCGLPLLASTINPWRFAYDCLQFDVTDMAGEDIGPATSPGNLTASMDVTIGDGCVPFGYGRAQVADPPVAAPAPVASKTDPADGSQLGTPATVGRGDTLVADLRHLSVGRSLLRTG